METRCLKELLEGSNSVSGWCGEEMNEFGKKENTADLICVIHCTVQLILNYFLKTRTCQLIKPWSQLCLLIVRLVPIVYGQA